MDLDGANVWIPQCVDDLIGGDFANMPSLNTNSTTSTNTTSGISITGSSSSSAYGGNFAPHATGGKTAGLPNFLYESTLNLLYSILKPDVLRADELVEFCHKQNSSAASSMWSMSSGVVSSGSTSSLDLQQHQQQQQHHQQQQQQQHQNDQPLFVSQLNSNTAAQLLVAAAAADFQNTVCYKSFLRKKIKLAYLFLI